jgi:hypothetical protein
MCQERQFHWNDAVYRIFGQLQSFCELQNMAGQTYVKTIHRLFVMVARNVPKLVKSPSSVGRDPVIALEAMSMRSGESMNEG